LVYRKRERAGVREGGREEEDERSSPLFPPQKKGEKANRE